MFNDNYMASLNLRISVMLKKHATRNMTSWGLGIEKRIKQQIGRFLLCALGEVKMVIMSKYKKI